MKVCAQKRVDLKIKMEFKYMKVRKELDTLGYFKTLSLESVPLVEKLLEDLKTTTESLQKYMKIAQNAIQDKENLEVSTGPYKSDNAKLVKECNDLHLTFLNYRGQTERDIKELRKQILTLTEENNKLSHENDKLRTRLRETELDLMKSATTARKSLQGKRCGNRYRDQSNYSSPDEELLHENLEIRHELNELKRNS
ncbi:hypothetical protein HHI36_010375 [Cryptolaemus montrouzieri]|uniref:Uncharacterized protein n=1 Tax=Cryptolaemus montrouzieri TaxID=559131 RepID=A0ABD2MIQ5_9CUCU